MISSSSYCVYLYGYSNNRIIKIYTTFSSIKLLYDIVYLNFVAYNNNFILITLLSLTVFNFKTGSITLCTVLKIKKTNSL